MYRRLRILESNYGREYGWYVEAGGRRLAALTDPRWADMFWYYYRLEPLATDPGELAMLFSDEFWKGGAHVTYRSREFGAVAPHAWAQIGAGEVLRQTGGLCMRGLYLDVRCYPWDCFLLWLRQLGRRSRP